MKKWMLVFAVLPLLLAGQCRDGSGEFTTPDSGPTGTGGFTAADIGTICAYDPAQPLNNPTNTCPKAGLTCVIASADGVYREFGNLMYEAIPLFTRFLPSGKDEGICTLVSPPGSSLLPACPQGSVVVKLSTGQHICMRQCNSSADCGREGYVCDQPFVNGATYDPQTGAVAPLDVNLCVPACSTDLPYCTRTFLYPDGAGGDLLMLAGSDLMGGRECEPVSGRCVDVTSRGSKFVGDQCTHSSECREGLLCIGGELYGPAGTPGFCANACSVAADRQGQPSGCQPGQGCDYFLDIGFCFPDCINVCGGMGQVCAEADPTTAGLREGQEWSRPRCIQCELSSLPCASSVDAGMTDAGHTEDGG